MSACTCDGARWFTDEQNRQRRPFLVSSTCPVHTQAEPIDHRLRWTTGTFAGQTVTGFTYANDAARRARQMGHTVGYDVQIDAQYVPDGPWVQISTNVEPTIEPSGNSVPVTRDQIKRALRETFARQFTVDASGKTSQHSVTPDDIADALGVPRG